ncbi:MAG: DUF262 domain-containing protein [Chitinophagaceae bacterium]
MEVLKEANKVELKNRSVGEVLGLKPSSSKADGSFELQLAIPDYQRIYCWEEINVIKLLDDILESSGKKYHLGSIILHKSNDRYNIVDGQQRLVTLCLFFLEMQSDINISLLDETFESKEAQEYIGYNKYLIRNYVANSSHSFDLESMLNELQFSVLKINDGSVDLAYTFFSNQNSRGKALTDYDLLKAHHLRYIYIPDQAKHLAERWDNLLLQPDNDNNDRELDRTLGIYLFRLRKWMRKNEWSNDEKYKVKIEFQAASFIREIPPFGEQFQFNESIQGGSHFFAYAETFVYKHKTFATTAEFRQLQVLSNETHWWYRDVIESLLFAYYLKFGTLYLSDALVGMMRIISAHRYQYGRANLKSLLKHASESEIVLMIDRATSPTFFLAELLGRIKMLPIPTGLKGIRSRFDQAVQVINENLPINMSSYFSTERK